VGSIDEAFELKSEGTSDRYDRRGKVNTSSKSRLERD